MSVRSYMDGHSDVPTDRAVRVAEIREAAKRIGIDTPAIRARLRRGWSWAEATSLPRGGEWSEQ